MIGHMIGCQTTTGVGPDLRDVTKSDEHGTGRMVVTLEDVTHRFRGHVALDRLSLAIAPGICGLLGPNGAGKTTLMRLLTTIYTVQSGSISVLGCDLGTRSGRRSVQTDIGYLPQSFGFYPNFTVSEFTEYFAILRGVRGSQIDRAIAAALARVDLTERATSKMKTLSGGMVRRAGIAQAIAHGPRLLILDEPTAGLDPEQRQELRKTLHDLSATTTVLISTHLAEDVAALGGHVLILNEGTLRFSGDVAQLIALGEAAPPDQNDLRTPIERGYSIALRG